MFCCGKDKTWLNIIQYESNPMIITDGAGREIFWEDLGRPDGK